MTVVGVISFIFLVALIIYACRDADRVDEWREEEFWRDKR